MVFFAPLTRLKLTLGFCCLSFPLSHLLAADAEETGMQMPPALVEVVEVEERKMAPIMEVPGSVISLNDASISAQVEGALLWILDVGTQVKKGDVIAKLDPLTYQINKRRMQAKLARLKADLKFRAQEVTRFQTLAAGDNASKARLQEEIAKQNRLSHDIDDAEASLELADAQLERTEIRAPFGGHLVSRLASVGEYLSIGEEVLRLVDTIELEVALFAPITVLPYLHSGEAILVKAGNESKQLAVRTIVPVGDKVSRMVEIRLTVPVDSWVIGTPVTISVPNGETVNSVAVPRDALVIKGSDIFVYRIDADMKAEQIKAQVGAVVGAWVALKDGLQTGDKIVIRGGERLMPGQLVKTK